MPVIRNIPSTSLQYWVQEFNGIDYENTLHSSGINADSLHEVIGADFAWRERTVAESVSTLPTPTSLFTPSVPFDVDFTPPSRVTPLPPSGALSRIKVKRTPRPEKAKDRTKKTKPPDSFICFRSHIIRQKLFDAHHQNDISREAARLWRIATPEVKQHFARVAEEEKERRDLLELEISGAVIPESVLHARPDAGTCVQVQTPAKSQINYGSVPQLSWEHLATASPGRCATPALTRASTSPAASTPGPSTPCAFPTALPEEPGPSYLFPEWAVDFTASQAQTVPSFSDTLDFEAFLGDFVKENWGSFFETSAHPPFPPQDGGSNIFQDTSAQYPTSGLAFNGAHPSDLIANPMRNTEALDSKLAYDAGALREAWSLVRQNLEARPSARGFGYTDGTVSSSIATGDISPAPGLDLNQASKSQAKTTALVGSKIGMQRPTFTAAPAPSTSRITGALTTSTTMSKFPTNALPLIPLSDWAAQLWGADASGYTLGGQ